MLVTDGISDVLAGPSDPLGVSGLRRLVARGPVDLDQLCQVVFESTSASAGADAMVLALRMEQTPPALTGKVVGLAGPSVMARSLGHI